jgi:hypothetical protein
MAFFKLRALCLVFLFAALAVVFAASPAWAEDAPPAAETDKPHAIEISPISPFINIYAVQYFYRFAPQNELIAGASYMNIHYEAGETHAPGVIVGLRHYL